MYILVCIYEYFVQANLLVHIRIYLHAYSMNEYDSKCLIGGERRYERFVECLTATFFSGREFH